MDLGRRRVAGGVDAAAACPFQPATYWAAWAADDVYRPCRGRSRQSFADRSEITRRWRRRCGSEGDRPVPISARGLSIYTDSATD